MFTYYLAALVITLSPLQNLDKLTKLRLLSAQSNRLTVIEGLGNLPLLEELYLSHNGIKEIQGLESQVRTHYTDHSLLTTITEQPAHS